MLTSPWFPFLQILGFSSAAALGTQDSDLTPGECAESLLSPLRI